MAIPRTLPKAHTLFDSNILRLKGHRFTAARRLTQVQVNGARKTQRSCIYGRKGGPRIAGMRHGDPNLCSAYV